MMSQYENSKETPYCYTWRTPNDQVNYVVTPN